MTSAQGYILVVEDDPSVRDVVTEALELAGYRVRAVGDGRQALEIVGQERPLVVLLDLMMPGLDGWQAQERLAELAPDVPLIVMSALARAQARADRYRAAGYLPKPFNIDELLDVVERAIRGR
jgi:CheY-like chemotaxis protein